VALRVEAALHDLVHIFEGIISPTLPPPLGDLSVENSEDPRPDARPPLESIQGLEKGHERNLRDILGFLGRQSGSPRRTKNLWQIGFDDAPQRGGVSVTHAFDQITLVEFQLSSSSIRFGGLEARSCNESPRRVTHVSEPISTNPHVREDRS